MLYGIDISNYQAGIDLYRVRREGFDFAIIKATQGSGYRSPAFARQLADAQSAGMITAAYHYVDTAPVAAQIANVRNHVPAGVSVIPDVEKGSGDIANARAVVNGLRGAGYVVPMIYLPRWYWERIGYPSLTGLPPLWSSRYPSTRPGTASSLYEQVPVTYWSGYGGLGVEMLQFASSAQVAGLGVDADAYLGSREQLSALLGGGQQPIGEPDVQLTDTWTDPQGNQQTVQTTLERVNFLWNVMCNDGSVEAHDPTHTMTNGLALIADSASWILELKAQVAAIQGALTEGEAELLAAINGVQTGSVDVKALAAAIESTLPAGLAKALGQKLAA